MITYKDETYILVPHMRPANLKTEVMVKVHEHEKARSDVRFQFYFHITLLYVFGNIAEEYPVGRER